MGSNSVEQNNQKRKIIPKTIFIYIILYCGLFYFYHFNAFWAMACFPFFIGGIIIFGALWISSILFLFQSTKPKGKNIWRKTILILLFLFFLILPVINYSISLFIWHREFSINYWFLRISLPYVGIFGVLPLIIGIIIFKIKIKIDRKKEK
jgi:hypothetical protein